MAATVAHVATGTKSAGGTSTISVAYPTGVRAGLMAIAARAAWNTSGQCDPSDETGWTSSGELFGGTGSSTDAHTSGARGDRKILDGSESGSVTFDQSGTPGATGGALGLMLLYESSSGEWDTVQTATGDDATHGTNRSATSSTNLTLQPGDLVIAIFSTDTDTSLATFGSPAITASGITFGTTTRRSPASAGVTTGSDGNVEVLDAVVSSGSGTQAVTAAFNTGTSQCGPCVFIVLRGLGEDVYWKSAFNTGTTPKDVVVPGCLTGDILATFIMLDGGTGGADGPITAVTTTTQAGSTGAWTEYEESINATDQDNVSGASATVTGDGSVTVRVSRTSSAGTPVWGFVVVRRRGGGALGANGSAVNGSTEAVNLTVGSDSWVGFLSGAWDAANPATAFLPSTGAIEIHREQIGGTNTFQMLLWKAQSSGTRDYGSSNHESTDLSILAAELPSGSTSVEISPSAISTSSSMAGTSVSTGSTVTATGIATSSTIPKPDVLTPVQPAIIATSSTMGAVTVQTGSSVSPASISTTSTVSGTASAGQTVTATGITTSSTIGAPSVRTGSSVSPATITTTSTMAGTVVSAGSTVSPSSLATSSTVASAGVSTGTAVSPTAVLTSSTVPTPTVQAGGSTTVVPAGLATTSTVGGVASAGQTVTAVSLATVSTMPAVTVAAGAGVMATTITTTSVIGLPSIVSAPRFQGHIHGPLTVTSGVMAGASAAALGGAVADQVSGGDLRPSPASLLSGTSDSFPVAGPGGWPRKQGQGVPHDGCVVLHAREREVSAGHGRDGTKQPAG